jgi:hypothetical protein
MKQSNPLQLVEGINFALSHDWNRLFHNKSFEDLLSDYVEDIPRVRFEGDARRPNAPNRPKGFSVETSESVVPLQSGKRPSLTFARTTLLEEFSDICSRCVTALCVF